MKFTLLFYTDGWESGPTVELAHVPAPGSIVWTGGRRRDEEDSMYYVDNVMYPERGMEREDTVYLYVRPYTGYTRYAPMTEADRIVERLAAVGEELERVGEKLERVGEKLDALLAESGALRETAAAVRDSVAALGREHTRNLEGLLRIGEQALQSADAMEDGQQLHIEKLDDIVLALEQMKEQM